MTRCGKSLRAVRALACTTLVFSPLSIAFAQKELQHWDGAAAGLRLGESVALIGDVDGDGAADVVAGQPGAVDPDRLGHVRVFSGRGGGLLFEIAGEAKDDGFGRVVTAVGDWNRDGLDDFAVASASGYVAVFSGRDGSRLKRFAGQKDSFGWSIAGVGDMNRDGWPDLLVGSPFDGAYTYMGGKAYFFSGKTGVNLFTLQLFAGLDFFGQCVAGVGDCNGDGFVDVAVSAPGAGVVSVFAGPYGSWLFDSFLDQYGDGDWPPNWSLAGVGDVDGDGHADVAVGVPYAANTWRGRALVLSGTDGTILRDWKDEFDDRFGFSVCAAGDVDMDGYADVAVGAPGLDPPNASTGVAFVYSGRSGALHQASWGPWDGSSRFGWTLAGGKDADGDGISDLLVGSPFGCSNALDDSGHALLLSIATPPIVSWTDVQRASYLGGAPVTIYGAYFDRGSGMEVFFGAARATNVVVVDANTLTCVAPPNAPGARVDLTARNTIGSGSREDAFVFTPALLDPWGDFRPDGWFVNTCLCDPLDTIWLLCGVDPATLPLPPFAGTLGIDPFETWYIEPKWPIDTFLLDDVIPDDPELSGVTVLFQALVGPKLAGKRRAGAFTNVVSFTIE